MCTEPERNPQYVSVHGGVASEHSVRGRWVGQSPRGVPEPVRFSVVDEQATQMSDEGAERGRVTPLELFFDLVVVFAITRGDDR